MYVLERVQEKKEYNNYLKEYARDITSQTGEDGIIEKIFSIMPSVNKWCVEFGAWDGKEFSNTWNLIHNQHWEAILIEADVERYNELIENNRNQQGVFCLNKRVDFTGEYSLDNLLGETDVPVDFDLLSIDIDGNDYHIWDSLTNYAPKLVIIEFNLTIPNDIIFVQDKNMSVNQGCSLRALINLASRKDYELIAVTDLNAFFVKSEFFHLFNISDNRIDCMFDQSKYETKIFQLFDGTLVLEGLKKLLWHGIEIMDEDIQVLPKNRRLYPDRIKVKSKQPMWQKSFFTLCKKLFRVDKV